MYGIGPRSILKDPNSINLSSSAIWKKVCFDDVHIREYGFILGDNPAVSKGAPLQIDWDYHNEDVIDVDIFEHCREPVRRHRKKIVLSGRKRAKILLNAGHTVEEIADMTLQCQLAKKQRVESIKNAGSWEIGNLNVNLANLNVNLADFMSGTAEVTGRTLKMVGLDAMGSAVGKAGMEVAKGTGKVVLGTGKVAGDLVVGTGKLGVGIVMGTGKVATDVVVGTGRLTADAVVGTGKLTGKAIVGTGQFLKTGTEDFARGSVRVVAGTLKGIGKAPRRITNIFSQGDLIREETLKDSRDHLRPTPYDSGVASVRRITNIFSQGDLTREETLKDSRDHLRPTPYDSGVASMNSSPKSRKRGKQRRNTEMNKRGLSPLRDSARRSTLNGPSVNLLVSPQEEATMDDLSEMELFMKHLQDMDPDHVKRVLSDPTIKA